MGCEVTGLSPPSDADQDETARIVTEAVEVGSSPQEIEVQRSRWGGMSPHATHGTILDRWGRGKRLGNASTMRPRMGLASWPDRYFHAAAS